MELTKNEIIIRVLENLIKTKGYRCSPANSDDHRCEWCPIINFTNQRESEDKCKNIPDDIIYSRAISMYTKKYGEKAL